MVLDQETVVEIVVSLGAVGLFVALIVYIGLLFNTEGLSETGAFALVGAIVAFILAMAVIGVALAFYMNRES